MKYLSVCSGIEAASVAWEPLGWEPVAFAEIEPFPSAVLAHQFPAVPNLGDMTKHETWSLEPGSVDLLVGGTPCQSFSVAGLRGGLSDPRGGLMLRYLELAQRLRPRWILWENVPGVLSSGGGRDFGSFLGALEQLGYGWAYRVLDAQHVRTHGHPRAVPQRRRRVFVVGCAGDSRRAAAVLFERESVRGNTSSRGKARQGAAGDVAGSLGCRGGGKRDLDGHDAYIPEIVGCVSAKWAKGGGPAGDEAYNLVAQPVAFDARQSDVLQYGPISGPLDTDGTSIGIVQTHSIQDCREIEKHQKGLGIGNVGDPAYTVDTTGAQPVAFTSSLGTRGGDVYDDGSCPTMRSRPQHVPGYGLLRVVRRLTPRECERLQGFPDDWTLIPWRGKPASDGPRYRALGNSMAVNCMEWLGQRIADVEERT